jgi:hypothetical protein
MDTHWEGVSCAFKKNGEVYYRSSCTYRGKHISLGSYDSAKRAHLAYREARLLVSEEGSFSLQDYTDSHVLAFEKWVILMNFRDNGIYLATPIYTRPRFFYYYLSPDHVLKFDLDDLFYYSSHKILCRGKHYFVNDYGMQVNLVTRYGIKNYAVAGVDFVFMNGDETDFRRENLRIDNIYHGVRKQVKNGHPHYCARIHLNGYILIGVYDTDVEAAIAYNKAIDLLRRVGVTKNFTPNFIEGLSARIYAQIYSSVRISPKISAYVP